MKINVDAISSIEEYLSRTDWRVKAECDKEIIENILMGIKKVVSHLKRNKELKWTSINC